MKNRTLVCIELLMLILLSPKAFPRQEQVIISGRVLQGSDKKPAEGATVELFLHHQYKYGASARPVFEEPFKKTITDPNGFFGFELKFRDLPSQLGPVILVVRKKGLAVGLEKISGFIFRDGQNEPIVIQLKPPVVLEGKVTDSKGNGIALAQVNVVQCRTTSNNPDGANVDIERINAITAHTDSAGLFKLDGIPPGHNVQVAVSKPGMARAYQWAYNLDIDKETRPMKFTLRPGATLKGVLIDKSTGKPISFARLSLNARSIYYSCLTDMEGTFYFEDIEPVECTLRLSGVSGYSGFIKKIILEAGKTTEIAYEISEGGAFSILVVDSERKKPLSDVTIRFTSSEQDAAYSGSRQLTTEASGRSRWRDLEPGEYAITDVYKEGYRTNYCDIRKTFLIESGKTTSLEFHLSPAPRLRGIVMDSEEKPVQGAEVLLYTKQSYMSTYRHVTEKVITDSEGKFNAAWDAVDKTPTPDYILARHAEKNLAALVTMTTPLDEVCLIRMETGVTVAALVENSEGQPLAEARASVTLFPFDEQANYLLTLQEKSDQEGVFEVPAIPRNCSIRGFISHRLYRTGKRFRMKAPLQEEFIVLDTFVLSGNR